MADLRPFFPYFGGKWRVAKRYPEPEHAHIIEPFAGAAGYATRYHDREVTLIDADEMVAGTWDYLITATADEIRSLPLWDGTWETVDDLHIPLEAKWVIGRWLNKGTARPCKRPSSWMRGIVERGDRLGCNFWGEGVRERLATQAEAIRHWRVIHGTYLDYPNEAATWFVDPPYQVAGKGYPIHLLDYRVLGEWSKSRRGQVIVCENSGADWLDFEDFMDIKATPGKNRTGVSREVIWVGGDA